MKKNILLLLSVLFFCISLTGCGEDPKLSKFRNDIDSFCSDVAAIDTEINNIDASSDTAREQLLDCLDRLDESFKVLADIDIPKDFSYIEELVDEASSYMTTAVESYHEAYSNNSFNEYTADYARQNYERAYKRVTVILKLLHGEEISDVDVTVEESTE
ncbi:MAG TPA: hypothetical protein VJY54_11935 [Lachnospiraceae bacterium]|nr:hypothetical protein [Lachnospiraceae bacterium]